MLKKIFRMLQKFAFPTLLLLIVGIISWKNYESGTLLSGWDTLHPEFNFELAFKRVFSGVWREDQGVGTIAAHSHMTELPRIFILWLSSFLLPTGFLRYFYFFLCLALGPLGVYYFLNYSANKQKSFRKDLASFLGASYYLLNLGTLQHFYVPFEMFATQFAFLPWLFFLGLKFLREKKKKILLSFALLSFFASPMAYAATLFYPYFVALALFLFAYSLLSKQKIERMKRSLIILGVVLVINAYWILPNIYSVFNQSETIANSRINTLFSPEAFLRNQEYGTLPNILIHKNFLFSWRAYDNENQAFVDLLGVWNDYLQNSGVLRLGYLMGAITLFGAALSLFKRNKTGLAFLPLGLLSLFFLINTNPPTGTLYSFLYEQIGIFREGFRMPFAKFSILFIFITSFYFGYFQSRVLAFLSKNFLTKILGLLYTVSILFALIIFMRPVFGGNLISPLMRTSIPQEYFQAFKWFNSEENGRIAKLPFQTPFNWEFHTWGYEGSGWFTWFSSQNPQLDRDFDRFSSYNESFYNQASFAVYAKDLPNLEEALEKYQVKYLFLDESVLNAGGSEELLFVPEIKELLSRSNHISMIQQFGFLSIYQTDFEVGDKFVSLPKRFARINTDLTYSPIDPIYSRYGTYIQDERGIAYPFVNFDKRGEVQVQVEGDKIIFINESKDAKVILPVENPIIESFGPERGFGEANNCDLKKKGSVVKENLGNEIFYGAYDGGVSCDYFYYPDLEYSQGYVLRIKGENKTGRGLKIYLQNLSTNRMDLEELLPNGGFDEYFSVLQRDIKGSGYTLNVETRSFGKISSENVLEAIEFYPIPIDWLINLYSDTEKDIYSENRLEILEVNKLGTAHYLVKTKGDGLMVLGQGYEDGWVAFPWLPDKKLEHVKVNSWANGWFVPESQHQTIIVYWPQYLEYLGLVLGLGGFVWLVIKCDD